VLKSNRLAPIGNPTAHSNPVRAVRTPGYMGAESVPFQATGGNYRRILRQ
jgi:hypothetical protein